MSAVTKRKKVGDYFRPMCDLALISGSGFSLFFFFFFSVFDMMGEKGKEEGEEELADGSSGMVFFVVKCGKNGIGLRYCRCNR